MEKIYLCIDLKTFYASVECVERGLDPFKTDLVVADIKRNKGAICLAISPKMKNRGIKNRCRIYEIPKNVKPIIAKPRMKKYMEYSAKIYKIYLKYVSKDDIHVYSIDEAFLDVTSYLKMYKMNSYTLAKTIITDIFKTTGITATCGIGTNLYLAKIALDIIAKKSKINIGYLTIDKYKELLWHHTPLTDFWQIGIGIENRLKKLHIKDMYDIAHFDEKKLYKEFGINAKLLIDHSKGIEPCTIKEIKEYKPKNRSLSNSQILSKDYNYKSVRNIIIEMIDNIILDVIKNNLFVTSVGIYIGYSNNIIPNLGFNIKLDDITDSYTKILNNVLTEYDYRININIPIRKVGISLNVIKKEYEQLNIFNYNNNDNEVTLEKTLNVIKDKYGKNSILRGVSYLDDSNQVNRNKLIGGHNAI